MALITFQVLDGIERGLVYKDVPTPFTVGREDDNAIQLNDERVSRFHVKIQEDGDRVILTDLDSTNGTRINGRPVQLHVLQIGDHVSIGRCLLVYGSADQIQERLRELDQGSVAEKLSGQTSVTSEEDSGTPEALDSERSFTCSMEQAAEGELFPGGPPPVPQGLQLGQQAQLSDLVAYLHDHLRQVLEAGEEGSAKQKTGKPRVLDWSAWQRLIEIEMQLAVYLRRIAEPDR